MQETKISENEDTFVAHNRRNSRILGDRAKLNISGISYEIRWETLRKFPNTRLGGLALMINDGAKSQIFVSYSCFILIF